MAVEASGISQYKKYHPVNSTIRYLDPFQMTAFIQGFVSPDTSGRDIDDLLSWPLFLGKQATIKEAPEWLDKELTERVAQQKSSETN